MSDSTTSSFEHCDSCGSLVEPAQRYCVSCGAHRRNVHDPAAKYLSKTTARSRTGSRPPASGRSGKSPNLLTALVVAMIPLAVGLGILIGRGSGNNDSKLLAALKAQKAAVAAPTTTAAAAAGTSNSGTSQTITALKSDYPLKSGWSVQIQTLSPNGTTQASVSKAEAAAKSKGAKNVGLIVASDYEITPAPTGAGYVIYAGAYKSKGQASQALASLSKKFSSAKVIRIQPVGTANSTTSGKVLAKTKFGVVHQVAGFKVTPKQLQAGAQIVAREAKQQGKNYINSQKGLPDQISVP